MHQITGDVIRKLFSVQVAPADFEMEEQELPELTLNVNADGELTPQSGLPSGVAPLPTPAPVAPARPTPAAQDLLAAVRAAQPQRPLAYSGGSNAPTPQTASAGPKVGRNDLCPCGSGKKYKKCHGAGI